MAKNLLFAVFLLFASFSYAQTIKTDVLVISGTPSGVAAAIQSARSKLKTVLIMPGAWLDKAMPVGVNYTIPNNPNAQAGIWAEFRGRVNDFYKTTPGYDTAYNAPLKFESYTGAAILKGIADTVKNLTVKLNSPFTGLKKDGAGWEVSITVNGKADIIRAKVIVDATDAAEVVRKIGATVPSINHTNDESSLFRTSIAAGDFFPGYYLPLSLAVIKNADNLLVTQTLLPGNSIEQLPAQLSIGQGVGCIAAYCAFFKTNTKKLLPRIIQQELLDFKGLLLPYADIKPNDKYIRAIQQIGATGLLKGVDQTSIEGKQFNFLPNREVTTAEIQPVLTEIYSRAFIWFNKEKPGEKFTVGNTLSLISEFTLTEPKTLQASVQKDWQAKYDFKSFDTARPITRLEFAILVNQYLNPFARKIDLYGNIVN
jgi:hypothetical protein